MPSIVTHHYFAKDALPKNKVNEQIYYLFAQSFDNLFYYRFFLPFTGKNIRTLGELGQQKKVNLYFKNILTYIKENNYINNKDFLGYLYGSITHYILDKTCHPFIIYYSGIGNETKYRGRHEKIETTIDALIYKGKTNKDLKDASLANELLPKIKFSKEFKNGLNIIFKNTFNETKMGTIYEKSSHTGHFILKYFVTDHYGLKKKIYHLKDYFFKGRKYENLSFYITNPNQNILNLNHNIWHHPLTNEIHNESFIDLYELALKETLSLIKEIDKYFNNKLSLENLLNKIKNNSYLTGIDCNVKQELKYFID